jgi:hypothetical protein
MRHAVWAALFDFTMVDLIVLLILGLLIFFDVMLMLYARGRFPNRARRSMLLDLPSVPLTLTAWFGHTIHDKPVTDAVTGVLILCIVAISVLLWEAFDGFPVHPVIASITGLICGCLFWPV